MARMQNMRYKLVIIINAVPNVLTDTDEFLYRV